MIFENISNSIKGLFVSAFVFFWGGINLCLSFLRRLNISCGQTISLKPWYISQILCFECFILSCDLKQSVANKNVLESLLFESTSVKVMS